MFRKIKIEYLKMMKGYHAAMMDKSYDVHNEYINNESIRIIASRNYQKHLKKWDEVTNELYQIMGVEYYYEGGV